MSRGSWIGHNLGGRYRIEEQLGQGGMSSVYKAADPNLRRYVAVKLIHSHLSNDPEFVRRFETEAAAVAQLRHPNIIQVFDFNHEDDSYYIVLEYVAGETLQERLKRLGGQNRRLTVDEVVKIGASVSEAVDYAHRRGMIHRDIKPANIMLNVQGEAILMDFGIAKMVGETHFTATGAVLGTALYMSPEQIRGERVDHRCDIYSLGVALFEMVSGELPFEADSAMTVMMMHLNDPVPDLLEISPGIAPPLKSVIEKALAKNPDERYQSAGELAAALHALLADDPQAGTQAIKTVPTAPESADPGSIAAFPGRELVNAETGESPSPQADVMSTPDIRQTTPPTEARREEGSLPSQAGPIRPQPSPAAAKSSLADALAGIGSTRLLLLIAAMGGGGILVLIIGVVLLAGIFRPSGAIPVPPTEAPTPLEQASPTTGALAVIDPTETAGPPTPAFTNIPLPTLEPTGTIPFIPFARINDIFIGDDRYVIVYETIGFEPVLPGGQHIHFFYNTVSEENAGNPGSGPWVIYGGPPPFRDLRVINKPQGATQVCVRVANSNHSILLGSGNCVDLPAE